jgi:ABC-type transport system involved in multi-copper enzyme maturation permease subunit
MLCTIGALLMTSFTIGSILSAPSHVMADFGRSFLFGPFVPIVVGYTMVVPQVANAQLRKDGEYLSLIFTRPISRCSYVMTKWLSGVIAIIVVTCVLTLMTLAFCQILHALVFRYEAAPNIIDQFAVIDVLCNALGYSALMILVSTFPHPWGKIALIVALYAGLLASTAISVLSYAAEFMAMNDLAKPLAVIAQILTSVLGITFDSYHIVNSSTFPIANVMIFISNVALYLTLSVLVMSLREFFYAND